MDGMSPTFLSQEDADQAAKFEAEQAEAEENAEIVRRAQAFYSMCQAATHDWRQAALDDLHFLAGEQWDANVKGLRDAQGRPALTVNRLPQFVRQITNEQRQSKPSVTINPVDSGADVRTAEVLQGVIRNIEVSSNADAAYAAGGQSAAITGLGYWDVSADWEDEKSFEQRITIKRIPNPLSVCFDPAAKELAGDDAREAIVSTDLSEGQWKARYPGVEMPKGDGWKGEGDAAAGWVAKDGVRLHEYRYVKDEPDVLVALPDGGAALLSEMEQDEVDFVGPLIEAGRIEHRKTTRRKACWARIAGDEVVEKGEFAGTFLQLVRVVGSELEIDGKTIYEGVIRHAKDTQRLFNWFVSSEAEIIALEPKAPWVGTKKQFEGFEEIWKTANLRPVSYLPYNPDPQAGGPPQRTPSSGANIAAVTNARMMAADDLKAVTGIYDGQLGARSNETSGRAILARQSQGQTANFHFQDNLAMAIRYTGRILVDLIPRIYSGPRVLRMLGEDGKPEMVPVNGAQPEEGQEPIMLDAGRYDVTVSMGPSYQSRRAETATLLMELLKVDPSISAVTRDLLVKSMDIPGGNEIAKRLEKTLPPDIRPQDEEQPPQAILAQQLQQVTQMNEQLTQALNATSADLQKAAEEAETKERIEMTKLRVQLALKVADLEAKEGLEVLRMERASIARRQQMTGFNEPTDADQPQMPMQGGFDNAG